MVQLDSGLVLLGPHWWYCIFGCPGDRLGLGFAQLGPHCRGCSSGCPVVQLGIAQLGPHLAGLVFSLGGVGHLLVGLANGIVQLGHLDSS